MCFLIFLILFDYFSYFLGSILLILSLQRIQSLELSCKYSTGRCFEYRTSLWSDCFNCFISNIHLSNPSTELTVNSKENPKTMEEVLRVEITLSTLKYVPNKLAKIFPSMTHLYLQDNEGLQTLKTEYFKGMTNLLQLWFWNNSITEIDGNTFMEIPSLQVLGVQTNKITKIDKDAFKGLKELTTLFVFSNFFESLHKDTFKDNKKLSYIHISHGKLINIPYAIFSHLSLLTKLDLRSNTCIDKLFTTVDTDLEQVVSYTNIFFSILKNYF